MRIFAKNLMFVFVQLLRSALVVSENGFRMISRIIYEHASRKQRCPLYISSPKTLTAPAGRMNASAESTGMGFYKGHAAVGGARQLDATNQFTNPRFSWRLIVLQLMVFRVTAIMQTRVTGWKNNIIL